MVAEHLGKFQSEVESNLTVQELAEWLAWFDIKRREEERQRRLAKSHNRRR